MATCNKGGIGKGNENAHSSNPNFSCGGKGILVSPSVNSKESSFYPSKKSTRYLISVQQILPSCPWLTNLVAQSSPTASFVPTHVLSLRETLPSGWFFHSSPSSLHVLSLSRSIFQKWRNFFFGGGVGFGELGLVISST